MTTRRTKPAKAPPAVDLVSLLTAGIAAFEARDYAASRAKFDEYIALRGSHHREPTITLKGITWGGDHVHTTYTRSMRLETEGMKAYMD